MEKVSKFRKKEKVNTSFRNNEKDKRQTIHQSTSSLNPKE